MNVSPFRTQDDVTGPVPVDVTPIEDAVPLSEAARRLGIKRDALKQRIRRGTIDAFKVDGNWFVRPPVQEVGGPRTTGMSPGDVPGTSYPGDKGHVTGNTDPQDTGDTIPGTVPYLVLVEQMRGEISFLREELRRKDHLLAAFAQRIPELTTSAAQTLAETDVPAAAPASPTPPSWWRRVFGRRPGQSPSGD